MSQPFKLSFRNGWGGASLAGGGDGGVGSIFRYKEDNYLIERIDM